MNKKGSKILDIDYKRWSKPAKIVAGIQIDSPYMDGKRNGRDVCDRYGNILSVAEQGNLMRYRDKIRNDWINNKESQGLTFTKE